MVEDGLVDGFEAVDHGAEVEVLLGVEFALGGEAFSFFGISKEFEEGGEEGLLVALRGEEAGLVVDADFRDAADGVADNGAIAEQGLDECAGLAFLIGGERMDVHGAHERADAFGRHKACEDDLCGKSFAGDSVFEVFAIPAVAYKQEARLRELGGERGEDVEQVVLAFVGIEPGHEADDGRAVRDAERVTDAFPFAGGDLVLGEVHGAGDDFKLFRSANSMVLEGFAHGAGDADEAVAARGGPAFGEDIGLVDEPGLARVKGQAVDGVDDGGCVFRPGGGASDDAGLAGVSVDDIGAFLTDQTAQGVISGEVVRREDGAAQGVDFAKGGPAFLGVRKNGAFRAVDGTVGEYDLMACGDLCGATQDGILLGTPEDQPGDDVKHFHGERFPFFWISTVIFLAKSESGAKAMASFQTVRASSVRSCFLRSNP